MRYLHSFSFFTFILHKLFRILGRPIETPLDNLLADKQSVDNSTSLLLAFYTQGNDILSVQSGESAAIPYKVYITVPRNNAVAGAPLLRHGATIYAVELDFNTQLHMIGIGKNASIESFSVRSLLSNYHMEKVALEGDFNDYFDLYVSKGKEKRVPFIFDPKAMASYIDFCGYNFWEIVGDELYVVIGSGHAKWTHVLPNLSVLVDHIRPAVTKTKDGEDPVYHEKSYGIYNGPPLRCPGCSSTMKLTKNTHVCPNGHGVLLFGRELIQLRHGVLKLDLPTPVPFEHQDLPCPRCGSRMSQTHYVGSKTVIDTCLGCAFRWIDATEICMITKKNDPLLS